MANLNKIYVWNVWLENLVREKEDGTFFGVVDDSGLNVGDGDHEDQGEGQRGQSGQRIGKKSGHPDFFGRRFSEKFFS